MIGKDIPKDYVQHDIKKLVQKIEERLASIEKLLGGEEPKVEKTKEEFLKELCQHVNELNGYID